MGVPLQTRGHEGGCDSPRSRGVREVNERDEARRLPDLRGRVKAARAAISTTAGAEEILRQDWVKAARFYARFRITEAMFLARVAD